MSCSFDILVMKDEYKYKTCFCEENVYKLAESRQLVDGNDGYVVFISNEFKQTPIWSQKKGMWNEYGERDCVVWDYHVVYMCCRKQAPSEKFDLYIYDFDTVLPFPCSASRYCEYSFPIELSKIPEKYIPRFRIIPSRLYLLYFASDRSHMKIPSSPDMSSELRIPNADAIIWASEPPEWPLIQGNALSGKGLPPSHNIANYWDMSLSFYKGADIPRTGENQLIDIRTLGDNHRYGLVVELVEFRKIVDNWVELDLLN